MVLIAVLTIAKRWSLVLFVVLDLELRVSSKH